MWPFGPRVHTRPANEEWVVVAEFSALFGAAPADLAVSELRGRGIRAVRLPVDNPVVTSVMAAGAHRIKVLVPPDRVQEARAALEGEGRVDGP